MGAQHAQGAAGGSQQHHNQPPCACPAGPRNLQADSNALVTAIRQTIEKQLIISMNATPEFMLVPHSVHCVITGVTGDAFRHSFPTASADNKVDLCVSGHKVFSPATANSSALAVHLDGFVTVQHDMDSVVMQGKVKLLNDRHEQAADSRSQRAENVPPGLSLAAPAVG